MSSQVRRTIPAFVASAIIAACSSDSLDSAFQDGPPPAPPAALASDTLPADADADAGAVVGSIASPDASVTLAAYTCDAPPKQCLLACTPGACTLACNPGDETDCAWSCAPPDCACTDQPTAACVLHDPVGECVAKCEKPECETHCPVCTNEPCAACTTQCKQPHCVMNCRAPTFVAASGGRRVSHCQAPKPSCTPTCAPASCTWTARTDGSGFDALCAPPSCSSTCADPGPPACDLTGCDEHCDPVGACTQECDKPSCTKDADTGVVTCDEAPTSCTPTCSGGACHVTTCD